MAKNSVKSRGYKNLDLWLALVLALVCLGVATAAYAAIQRLERPAASALTEIDKGQTIFLVLHNGGCAGEFKADLSTHKSVALNAKGSLQTRVEARLIPATISVSALFNPLGQLYNSELSINAMDTVSMSLKTDGVNPITLALSSSAAGQAYSGKLELPGPVNLTESRLVKDRYILEYEPANRFKPLRTQNLLQNLLAPLGLRIEQRRDPAQRCDVIPLDLSAAVSLLQQFSKGSLLASVLPAGAKHD